MHTCKGENSRIITRRGHGTTGGDQNEDGGFMKAASLIDIKAGAYLVVQIDEVIQKVEALARTLNVTRSHEFPNRKALEHIVKILEGMIKVE